MALFEGDEAHRGEEFDRRDEGAGDHEGRQDVG
jgi:hypothetical protein